MLGANYFQSLQYNSVNLKGSPGGVVQRFRLAIEGRNVNALHAAYANLREEFQRSRQSSHTESHTQAQELSSLTEGDIRGAMKLALGRPMRYGPLSKRADKGRDESKRQSQDHATVRDGQLVQQMFVDMKALFGFSISSAACGMSLQSLAVQRAKPSAIFHYYLQLKSRFDSYSESIKDLNIAMGECSKINDVDTARTVWNYIVENEVVVDGTCRDLIVSILLKDGDVDMALGIAFDDKVTEVEVREQLALKIKFDLAWLLEGLCRAGEGLNVITELVASSLYKRLSAPGSLAILSEWHAYLIYVGFTSGGRAARKVVEDAILASRVKPDQKTFSIVLLCHAKQLQDISDSGTEDDVKDLFKLVEDSIGITPDKHAFSIGINALLGKPPSLLYQRGPRSDRSPQKRYQSAIKSLPPHLQSTLRVHPGEKRAAERVNILSAIGSEHVGKAKTDETSVGDAMIQVPQYTPGQIHEATSLYDSYRSLGMLPDNAMVHALLNAHANAYLPSVQSLERFYRDLRASLQPQQGSRQKGTISREVYDVLLYAFAKVRNLPKANRIFQDMIKDGVSLSQSNQSNLAIMMIQASESHEAAFKVYTQLRDSVQLSSSNVLKAEEDGDRSYQRAAPFDRMGWLRIIDSFSKLEFDEKKTLPPAAFILEMVNDFKQSGNQVEAILYTTLLRYYGRRALKFEDRNSFRSSIIEIHSFLQNQENLEPDLILVTALMDAYNRVDLPLQALEVWNRLVIQHTHVDSACIAVLLDTCGRSGKLQEARRAWEWVRKRQGKVQRLQCNKGVWDAYVECLSRCGRLEEAIDVTFGEMTSELSERNDRTPDAKTMEMLLRFASARSQRWILNSDQEFPLLQRLKERLAAEMPAVWDKVKLIHIPL
ncbi:hypothetical protein CBS101457_002666 [Exobasidium rhododendri]|nr:hypothetical protein CBS101457_002666 [Exobasidium rhododendri]